MRGSTHVSNLNIYPSAYPGGDVALSSEMVSGVLTLASDDDVIRDIPTLFPSEQSRLSSADRPHVVATLQLRRRERAADLPSWDDELASNSALVHEFLLSTY